MERYMRLMIFFSAFFLVTAADNDYTEGDVPSFPEVSLEGLDWFFKVFSFIVSLLYFWFIIKKWLSDRRKRNQKLNQSQELRGKMNESDRHEGRLASCPEEAISMTEVTLPAPHWDSAASLSNFSLLGIETDGNQVGTMEPCRSTQSGENGVSPTPSGETPEPFASGTNTDQCTDVAIPALLSAGSVHTPKCSHETKASGTLRPRISLSQNFRLRELPPIPEERAERGVDALLNALDRNEPRERLPTPDLVDADTKANTGLAGVSPGGEVTFTPANSTPPPPDSALFVDDAGRSGTRCNSSIDSNETTTTGTLTPRKVSGIPGGVGGGVSSRQTPEDDSQLYMPMDRIRVGQRSVNFMDLAEIERVGSEEALYETISEDNLVVTELIEDGELECYFENEFRRRFSRSFFDSVIPDAESQVYECMDGSHLESPYETRINLTGCGKKDPLEPDASTEGKVLGQEPECSEGASGLATQEYIRLQELLKSSRTP